MTTAHTPTPWKCFACDCPLKNLRQLRYADTGEDQFVLIGPECLRHVLSAGIVGWQPPKGGPTLYPMTEKRRQYFQQKGMLR